MIEVSNGYRAKKNKINEYVHNYILTQNTLLGLEGRAEESLSVISFTNQKEDRHCWIIAYKDFADQYYKYTHPFIIYLLSNSNIEISINEAVLGHINLPTVYKNIIDLSEGRVNEKFISRIGSREFIFTFTDVDRALEYIKIMERIAI